MTAPELIIVGTGRCGTHSIVHMLDAAGIQAEHEYHMLTVIPMVFYHQHHIWPDDVIAEMFDHLDWPRAVADFKLSHLIPMLADLWPDTRFCWLTRNAADTVDSMVRTGWYLPEDDWEQPRGWWVWRDSGSIHLDVNYKGHRTRPDRLGLVSDGEWGSWPQVKRCAWWVRYCSDMIETELGKLDSGRWLRVDISDPSRLFDWLGVDMPELVQLAAS